MRSPAVSTLWQSLASSWYCSMSLFSMSCLMLLLSEPVDAVDLAELKHCFERYDGHRLSVETVSPFLSEWRRSSEEQCLEFCVRSASRCGSIVFDKVGHICHYFTSKGLANLVRQRKFVYLRVTDRNCMDSLLAKLLVRESATNTHKNGGDADGTLHADEHAMPSDNVHKMALRNATVSTVSNTSAAVGGGRNESSSLSAIGALLAQLDAELAKQSLAVGSSSPVASEPFPASAAAAVPFALNDADEATALLAKKGLTISDREIRRSPRINDRGNRRPQHNVITTTYEDEQQRQAAAAAATTGDEQQQELVVEKELSPHYQGSEGELSMSGGGVGQGRGWFLTTLSGNGSVPAENPCENSDLSHRIWLAVENTRIAQAVDANNAPQKAANTPRECVRVCTDLMVGSRPCNLFSFFEHEKRCIFGHSGNEFPAHGSLESIHDGNFSERTFRQFCFPASLSPFENCAEFLAFTDYRLEMEPREIFDGLPASAQGLSACIELCVLSSEYRCMSATFDSVHGICRLFNEHSLTNPNVFREHRDQSQLYFENGCVESAGEITQEISQKGSVRRMHLKL